MRRTVRSRLSSWTFISLFLLFCCSATLRLPLLSISSSCPFLVNAMSATATSATTRRTLPSPLVIGYVHDARRFSDKIDAAVRDGVNVIVWSFVHMALDDDDGGTPVIRTDLDLPSISAIKGKHRSVVHVAAFGGWNGPHPPRHALSGEEWCDVFEAFNERHGGEGEGGERLFDGVDWDLEGHDDRSAPTSAFAPDTLDVMADFSVAARRRGLFVSMAPAESYLDALLLPKESSFSYALNLPPPAWSTEDDRRFVEDAGFAHAGRQCYARVLRDAGVDVFDWIAVQYYESFSRFVRDTTRPTNETANASPTTQRDALLDRVRAMERGVVVRGMNDDDEHDETTIVVPYEKIVLGFANGWASPTRNGVVEPESVRDVFDEVRRETNGERRRSLGGVMFWTIEEEGKNGVFLARSLSAAIAARPNDADDGNAAEL